VIVASFKDNILDIPGKDGGKTKKTSAQPACTRIKIM